MAKRRMCWPVMTAVLLACTAAVSRAQERGDDEALIRMAVQRFWGAFGDGNPQVFTEVLRSPVTMIGVSRVEGGQEHVVVQKPEQVAADLKGKPPMRISPSEIKVQKLSRNSAYATYTVTCDDDKVPLPMVTMLAVDGVWKIISTTVPAPSSAIARAQFTVNPYRHDPYKNFKFRVKWDGRYVAGVSKVSPLRRVTAVVEQRVGGDASSDQRSPGRTKFEPIILERGKTHDLEFEKWAHKVWRFGAGLGSEVSLKDFRKDIIIEIYNEAGQLAMAYKVYRCWVSEYQALPDLDAGGDAVAIETITIQHEGWERDTAVTEPAEPTVN